MANERWISPFKHTIAYILFVKHFTELNNIYWAHVPAASTVEKKALEALGSPEADPKTYFLIHDEDDRRVSPSYKKWKESYRMFSIYTRMNMLMLLSSCFETYLRTIISISVESKPGLIIGCPDAIDGIFLLKSKIDYGDLGNSSYQYLEIVESICKGDWPTRASNYVKYFGQIPIAEDEIKALNELRLKRNLVGHYFGRAKKNYETPLSFTPEPVQKISHDKLKEYFSVVYHVVQKIDVHLHVNYIGSYDIIKYYYQRRQNGDICGKTAGAQAKELQKLIGGSGLPPVGNEYYFNLITYFTLDDKDNTCKYGKKACIIAINRKLDEAGISIIRDERPIRFSSYHFNLFCKAYLFHENIEYCEKHSHTPHPPEYYYSMKAIDFIVTKIIGNNTSIIDNLHEAIVQTSMPN